MASYSPELLWECVKGSSSFIRKTNKQLRMPVMTAEPGNSCGLNSYKYSGLANKNVLDIAPVKKGTRETVILTTSSKKVSRGQRPASRLVKTGVRKQSKKALSALEKKLSGGYYRRDLLELAKVKYAKITKSFKKKKVVVKSRRSGK